MGNSQKKILLLPTDERALKKNLSLIGEDNYFLWIYFGKNVTQFRSVQQLLNAKAEYLPIGEILQQNAIRYRQEYIDFIGTLGRDIDLIAWCLTSLSEKNPYVSVFYQNFCYVSVARDVAEKYDRNIIFVCESRGVSDVLEDMFRLEKDMLMKRYGWDDQRLIAAISDHVKPIRRTLLFLAKYSLRILFTRINQLQIFPIGNKSMNSPQILLHAWVDNRSFPDEGGYHDVYFGDLRQILEKQGWKSTPLLNILPSISFGSAIKKVRERMTGALIFEDFISFLDLITAILFVRRHYPRTLPTSLKMAGVRVDALIRMEIGLDRRFYRAEQSFLSFLAAKKILQKMDVCSFIYTFENYIWEKMFILGLHGTQKKVGIIGYAHTTVNPMETSYSISQNELDRIPLPDRIVVNGEQSRMVLGLTGFTTERIVVGGSLRFPHIGNRIVNKGAAKKSNIIVALSVDFNKSVELLLKASEAFISLSNAEVIIKPHPTMPVEKIQMFLSTNNSRFKVVTDSIESLLPECFVLFFADSTVAFEAIAYGVPAVHVQSDFHIDMNVFAGITGMRSVLRPYEMRMIADSAIGGSLLMSDEQRDRILSAFFSKVDEKVIIDLVRPFLPPSNESDTSIMKTFPSDVNL